MLGDKRDEPEVVEEMDDIPTLDWLDSGLLEVVTE